MVRFQVVALIAFLFAARAFASRHDLTLPTYGPTSYAVRDPLVATNGETFLALWTVAAGNAGSFIYASVADAGGHRTTQASFRLLPFAAELIDLTTLGSDYLVLWQNASGLHSSVVSGNGVVIREGPSISSPTSQFMHIHTNGRTVLFTHHTSGPLSWPTETLAQLSSIDGTAIGYPILLGDQTLQAATPFGDDYVTITTERSGTYFLRLDAKGHVVVPKRLIGATQSLQNVVAASNGSEILVATLGMVVALSGDGTVLNTRSFAVEPGSESSLIWTGNAYLHIRRKGFSAVAQRLDRLGMPLDSTPLTIDAGISSAATRDGIVYAAGRTADRGVVGFALTTANVPLNGVGDVLSVTATVQTAPVLTSDGVDFLTGWTEEIAQSHLFTVTRVSRSATPIDSQQTDLGPVEPPERPRSLSLDATGTHHSVACIGLICLAVWEDSYTIRGKWSIAGSADAPSFVIGNGHISDQAVVWNGREFFVVWNAGELYSATVSTAGVVSERAQLTTGLDYLSSPPKVAWDGHRYLLMFTFDTNSCDCWNLRSAVYFYALAAGGKLLGQDGFNVNFMDAHLTTSGHDFLVIYDHHPLTTIVSEVAARRVIATDTTVQIDPAITLFQWFGPTSSSVTWNGQDYVAAWRYGSGSTWWLTSARVTTSAFPDRRATASGVPDRQVKPAIASNAAGESVIVVSESTTPGEPARLRAYAERELDPLPPLPASPSGVSVTGTASSFTVHWQSDGRDVAGFVVERASPGWDNALIIVTAASDERSVVVSGTPSVRVRAFNASGLSEPSEVGVISRRRAAGR